MRVFLACPYSVSHQKDLINQSDYILETFYEIADWEMEYLLKAKAFLLDSGAFTFMSKSSGHPDFDEYLEKYIKFINKYDVKLFFELDVDSIAGYEKVLDFRKRLEDGTGKACIPVWHKSRGLDNFIETAQTYSYMAIGGYVTKAISKSQMKHAGALVKLAHEHGCRVHGLGYTDILGALRAGFDSVDSSRWVKDAINGRAAYFKGVKPVSVPLPNSNKINWRALRPHNWLAWCAMQKKVDGGEEW